MSTLTTTTPGGLRFLRFAITAQAVAALLPPITAGVMLTWPGTHALHSAASYTLFTVTLIHLLAAILAWRPFGGTPGALLSAAGVLVLVLAQVFLGIAHVTTLHVPLGVLLFGVTLLQCAWVWGALFLGPHLEGRSSASHSLKSPRRTTETASVP
jgi:heme A synthase